MTRLAVSLAGALFLVCLARDAMSAERLWVEVKSQHFTVASDAGEKTARDIAWQFEQVSAVLKNLWPWVTLDIGKPLLVLAPRDEQGMKDLAPQYWEQKNGVHPSSLSIEGADRTYVALRADVRANEGQGAMNPYLSAYWSYTSLAFNHSLKHRLPPWLSRGMASVMSNTIVRSPAIQIGRPIPWHVQRVRKGGALHLPEMFQVRDMTPWVKDADRLSEFDALSWALVHFLMFADDGAHRQYLDRFISLANQAQPTDAALDFGLGSAPALEQSFRTYLFGPTLAFLRINTDVLIKPESFPIHTLSPAEQLSERAAFFMAERRPVEAKAAMEAARQADSKLAASYEVEGLLAEVQKSPSDARAAYLKAIELGSSSFYVHYRWAGLSREPGINRETMSGILSALQRSIDLNSGFAPAYAMHGEVAAALGQTDQGLQSARTAIAL